MDRYSITVILCVTISIKAWRSCSTIADAMLIYMQCRVGLRMLCNTLMYKCETHTNVQGFLFFLSEQLQTTLQANWTSALVYDMKLYHMK